MQKYIDRSRSACSRLRLLYFSPEAASGSALNQTHSELWAVIYYDRHIIILIIYSQLVLGNITLREREYNNANQLI